MTKISHSLTKSEFLNNNEATLEGPSTRNRSASEPPYLRRDTDSFEAPTTARTPIVFLEPENATPPRKSEMLRAAQMMIAKGPAWNDAEMREAIMRAGWGPTLVNSMDGVPLHEQDQARALLAKQAVVYLEQNDWLKDNGINDFVRENREMIWTLFAAKGAELGESKHLGTLALDYPDGYRAKILQGLAACAASQSIAEVDDALEAFKNDFKDDI